MRRLIAALLASAPVALASQSVFSVHDDLLAFPQYEVVFPNSLITDVEADSILKRAFSATPDPQQSSSTTGIESNEHNHGPFEDHAFDPAHKTFQVMNLDDEPYLCAIPIVEPPVRNETSEAEARAAEQRELARATDRGWELLQDLEDNCLYYTMGWWSYSFCYNSEILQFHPLPPQPGNPVIPPQKDPTTKEYVLGRARPKLNKEDEWGNQLDVPKTKNDAPKTDVQIKGDTRYLMQRMDHGTICDLTGRPRQIEIQYHCNPHVTDRIGYIKEITTCSYLMVVYTPRLCNDMAFVPPLETKANGIVCRAIVSEDDLADRAEYLAIEVELDAAATQTPAPVNIGGVIIGGGKWAGKEGQRMPVPPDFGGEHPGRSVEIIAQGQSVADGGRVEVVADDVLKKLAVDPDLVPTMLEKVQEKAKGKGWKVEVVDAPGHIREILGTITEEEDEDGEEEGSEEVYKHEL